MIYGGEMIPKTLSRWYKKAALQEQLRQDIKQALGNTPQRNNMQYVPRKYNFQPQRDSNAMDVDILMAEERTNLMRREVPVLGAGNKDIYLEIVRIKGRRLNQGKKKRRRPGKAKI